MMISTIKIIFLTSFAITCLADVDICFWEASVNCDTSDTHVCCNNLDSDRCCDTGNNGFCVDTGVFGLTEESEEIDEGVVYDFFTNGSCGDPEDGICDGDCCEFLGESESGTCSGIWAIDSEEKKVKAKRTTEQCLQPNFAYYIQEDGSGRGIYLRQGQLDGAVQMIRAKDFDGLKGFDDWDNQE